MNKKGEIYTEIPLKDPQSYWSQDKFLNFFCLQRIFSNLFPFNMDIISVKYKSIFQTILVRKGHTPSKSLYNCSMDFFFFFA